MSGWPASSLHLDAGRTFRGGQRQVLALLTGLERRGHAVHLACPADSDLARHARAAGIACTALPFGSSYDLATIRGIVRLAGAHRADVVHAHDARSHALARFAQAGTRLRVLRRNLFVTRRNTGGGRGPFDRWKYAAPGMHYIAISSAVRAALEARGVAPGEIAVVPSGTSVVSVPPDRRRGTDPWRLGDRGAWVVGTVGALTHEKKPGLLLDAFRSVRIAVPEAHLLVAGDGPLRDVLASRALATGIAPAVTLAGHLEDVAPAYAVLDVFVLASDAEGLCTAVLDAFAWGVPVVTTAAAGVLDVARDGTTALVVPCGDAAALAEAVLRLRAEPALAARLAAAGRTLVASYTLDAMVEGTLAAYTRLGDVERAGSPAARAASNQERSS